MGTHTHTPLYPHPHNTITSVHTHLGFSVFNNRREYVHIVLELKVVHVSGAHLHQSLLHSSCHLRDVWGGFSH